MSATVVGTTKRRSLHHFYRHDRGATPKTDGTQHSWLSQDWLFGRLMHSRYRPPCALRCRSRSCHRPRTWQGGTARRTWPSQLSNPEHVEAPWSPLQARDRNATKGKARTALASGMQRAMSVSEHPRTADVSFRPEAGANDPPDLVAAMPLEGSSVEVAAIHGASAEAAMSPDGRWSGNPHYPDTRAARAHRRPGLPLR